MEKEQAFEIVSNHWGNPAYETERVLFHIEVK